MIMMSAAHTHRSEQPAVHDLCDDHEDAAAKQGVAPALLDQGLPLLRGGRDGDDGHGRLQGRLQCVCVCVCVCVRECISP